MRKDSWNGSGCNWARFVASMIGVPCVVDSSQSDIVIQGDYAKAREFLEPP
jgi:hypothetical protein